ncbi:MAG: heavy metal sensor histidine kinase [Pseudomonadota bacterium]
MVQRKIRLGLGANLSLWLALQASIALGLICGAVYVVISLVLSQRQDDTLDQKQSAVYRLLTDDSAQRELRDLEYPLKDMLAGHADLSLRIVDAGGRLLFERAATQEGIKGPPASKQRSFSLAAFPGRGQPARVDLTLDLRADNLLLRQLAWTLALSALAGAAAISAGAYWLVHRGLLPLRRLVEQTRHLTTHDLEQRFDGSHQPREIQPLIEQVNALLDRLTLAYRQMEAFNADVAHELNTPLASLISSCELTLRRPRSTAEMTDVLGSNLEDLRRMSGIVADMLFLSHADSGSDARREPVNSMAAVVHEVVEFHDAAMQEAGVQAQVHGESAAQVDTRLVRRAVSNLLGNATRYARRGSTIAVRIGHRDRTTLEICVENEGPSISEDHLPHLFDRFYRADPSRRDADRNHGLGLSIVAAIARMHGGATFASSGDGLTRIGLTLRL